MLIENSVFSKLVKSLRDNIKFTDNELSSLMADSLEIFQKRKNLNDKLNSMQKAENFVNDFRLRKYDWMPIKFQKIYAIKSQII